jgi:type I restriction-modification system DNA methylase subunit
MAIKKSELYRSLWKSCDELRSGMDASQYKDYVLVLLFVKYVSDKYAGEMYAPLVIPDGGSFKDMVALKAADETHQGVTIYGQEMDNATAALAKMNMILHGNPTAGCALLHR